jgi:hypothetical protein
MVTAGANQAFVNLVLTLCDASDKVVLFAPYYFNHLVGISQQQLSLVSRSVPLPCAERPVKPIKPLPANEKSIRPRAGRAAQMSARLRILRSHQQDHSSSSSSSICEMERRPASTYFCNGLVLTGMPVDMLML